MKKAIVICLGLSLSACASINNPITLNEIGGMESAYGIALSAAVAYRSLPLCKTGFTATLTNVCAQRSIIVKLQAANRGVIVAVHAARDFVVNNPTLDPTTVISTAQRALSGLQAIEATYNIH